jgi:hypothetical protein
MGAPGVKDFSIKMSANGARKVSHQKLNEKVKKEFGIFC